MNMLTLKHNNNNKAYSLMPEILTEGPIVLGYNGFLERIRFAFDPGIFPGEQIFYFGKIG